MISKLIMTEFYHLGDQEDIHALASKAEFLVLTRSNTDLRRSSG